MQFLSRPQIYGVPVSCVVLRCGCTELLISSLVFSGKEKVLL